MKSFLSVGAALLPLLSFVSGIELNTDDEASLKSATKQYAAGLLSYYKNGAGNVAKEDVGIFPKPHYWWEAGAAWGGLIEYTQFTGDSSHVKTLTDALVANYGPNNDILLSWRKSEEGNDDQAFWAFATMSALEYQFPEPDKAPASYLEVTKNCFDNIVSRWDTSTCNGGLKWQIYSDNDYGYDYKNSISNGAAFALAARLARYTGNQTYADWATKLYDWSTSVGLVSDKYEVFDGTDDKSNCAKVADKTEWSYNLGVYIHGAAAMYNFTNGDQTWKKHTSGFLDHAATFFKPYDNATDIMYELPCETGETGRHCNLDQQSFKAYLARFLAKTAVLAPYTRDKVTDYLKTSAAAAAKSCSGPGNACGSKWYTGGYDGTSGVGQQLSALEVTQALLMLKQGVVPAIKDKSSSSSSSAYSASASSTPASSSIASSAPASSTPASSTPQSSVATSAGSDTTPVASSVSSTADSSSASSPSSTQGYRSSGLPEVPSPSATPSSVMASSSPAGDSTPSPTLGAVTTGPPGVFPENNTVVTLSTSCTPSTTVTVYVPPVVTPPANTSANISVPAAPPSATPTGPETFPGAAANIKATGLSVFVALAVAMLSGLF